MKKNYNGLYLLIFLDINDILGFVYEYIYIFYIY